MIEVRVKVVVTFNTSDHIGIILGDVRGEVLTGIVMLIRRVPLLMITSGCIILSPELLILPLLHQVLLMFR